MAARLVALLDAAGDVLEPVEAVAGGPERGGVGAGVAAGDLGDERVDGAEVHGEGVDAPDGVADGEGGELEAQARQEDGDGEDAQRRGEEAPHRRRHRLRPGLARAVDVCGARATAGRRV